jgi:hypothetical protein
MDIPTLGLDASERKSEGYERTTYTIINKLQYPRLLLIYNKFIIVIKNFNYFRRCNSSY